MKKVYVLLAGGKVDTKFLRFKKRDILVCADGGIKRVLGRVGKNKIVLLGDFDSVNKKMIEKKKVEILEFPKDKDMTDGELAVEYVCKHYDKTIKKIVFGGVSDRLDHTLENILVMFVRLTFVIS